MDRFIIISGCSGGGKSTLLAELARRGFAVVEEPGRRIVDAELNSGGTALPWVDIKAFLDRLIALAIADYAAACAHRGIVFFDRGLIDATAALEALTGEPEVARYLPKTPFHRQVFLAPPWPEIHVIDQVRRHAFDEAVVEYDRLAALYPALGYQICLLPKMDVASRADTVMAALAANR